MRKVISTEQGFFSFLFLKTREKHWSFHSPLHALKQTLLSSHNCKWSGYILEVIRRHIPSAWKINATVEKLPVLNLPLLPSPLRARSGSPILITSFYLCGRQRSLTYIAEHSRYTILSELCLIAGFYLITWYISVHTIHANNFLRVHSGLHFAKRPYCIWRKQSKRNVCSREV